MGEVVRWWQMTGQTAQSASAAIVDGITADKRWPFVATDPYRSKSLVPIQESHVLLLTAILNLLAKGLCGAYRRAPVEAF